MPVRGAREVYFYIGDYLAMTRFVGIGTDLDTVVMSSMKAEQKHSLYCRKLFLY